MKPRQETIIRLNTEHDKLFVIEHGVQRQVTSPAERASVLSSIGKASVMNQVGAWATWAVKA